MEHVMRHIERAIDWLNIYETQNALDDLDDAIEALRFQEGDMEYKVWIEIEELDPDTQEGTNIDPGFGCAGTFDTLEEATNFAQAMHNQEAQ